MKPNHLFFFIFPAMALVSCSQGAGGAPEFLKNSTPNITPNSSSFEIPVPSQKLIYHVGPIDLPAGQTVETMLDKPATLHFQVTEPIWMTGFEPKVIDSEGKDLSGGLLHKAILFNKHDPNSVCASGNEGNPFAVATSTLTKVALPEGFGYRLTPEDPLEAKVFMQNPTDKDYRGLYFSFEIDAIPVDKAKGFADVIPLLLDANPSCDHKPIAIEPGAFVEKSATYTSPENGSLMVAYGELSDYGVAVSLAHQEGSQATVIPFWRAQAKLDETHHILSLTPNPFLDPNGKKIKKGDKLTLGVTFDNFSDQWQNGATGSAMVYLTPTAL